jgi:hypothetical protein
MSKNVHIWRQSWKKITVPFLNFQTLPSPPLWGGGGGGGDGGVAVTVKSCFDWKMLRFSLLVSNLMGIFLEMSTDIFSEIVDHNLPYIESDR